MSSTHLQYTVETTFRCWHTYPPAVLPNGVSSNRPPATLGYDCLDCMARHARNSVDAIYRQYRGPIQEVELQIQDYRQAPGFIWRRVLRDLVARREELKRERADDVQACWVEFYRRYGP